MDKIVQDQKRSLLSNGKRAFIFDAGIIPENGIQ
jgi:hypothetical protein